MTKRPTLCALVTTYNHELYIAECLESILAQDYDEDFKIYVGEDLSTDRTAEILRDFYNRYPNRIVPIFREKNLGGHGNLLDCINRCDAEWVAWVEGDDFWCDKSKISKQMALIQKDPEATICFAKANSIDTMKIGFIENKIFGPADNFIKHTYTRNDLLRGNFVHTCTIVFKKSAVWPLPEWYSNWHLGDWTLLLHALRNGHAVYLNEIVSTYRIHGAGVWSGTSFEKKLLQQEKLINFLIQIETSKKARKILNFNLLAQKIGLFVIYFNEKRFMEALSKMGQAITTAIKADWTWTQFVDYAKKGLKMFSFLRKKKMA